jgi:hypothetical protein
METVIPVAEICFEQSGSTEANVFAALGCEKILLGL